MAEVMSMCEIGCEATGGITCLIVEAAQIGHSVELGGPGVELVRLEVWVHLRANKQTTEAKPRCLVCRRKGKESSAHRTAPRRTCWIKIESVASRLASASEPT